MAAVATYMTRARQEEAGGATQKAPLGPVGIYLAVVFRVHGGFDPLQAHPVRVS